MGFLDKLLGREKKAVDKVEETLKPHDHDHDHGDAGAAAPTPPAPGAAPETGSAPESGERAGMLPAGPPTTTGPGTARPRS